MTKFLLVKYQTRGDEVYESETGPTIGYDNIQTGLTIVSDDQFDGDYFDPETYSSIEVVGELDANQIRALHRQLSKAVCEVGV